GEALVVRGVAQGAPALDLVVAAQEAPQFGPLHDSLAGGSHRLGRCREPSGTAEESASARRTYQSKRPPAVGAASRAARPERPARLAGPTKPGSPTALTDQEEAYRASVAARDTGRTIRTEVPRPTSL